MAWSTPRTWATLEAVTAANMNTYVSDDLSWLGISRSHCQVRDAGFVPTAGSWASPSWDSLTTNVNSMAALSTGYITATTAGFYMVGASCLFGSDATAGMRALMLSTSAAGGGTVYAQTNTTQHAGNASGAVVSTMVQLSAGATVYSSMFVPTGFAVGNGTSTWGITNVRMWAIWMTV